MVDCKSKDSRVITGTSELVRFSYVNLYTAKYNGLNGNTEYSTVILIPKTATQTVNCINEAIEQAVQKGSAELWRGQRPNGLKTPLRDGDLERADKPEFKGMYFMTLKSKADTGKPQVQGPDGLDVLDASEWNSGDYGRVSFRLYAYDQRGNRGVGAGLGNVRFLQKGEPLVGRLSTADDDFGDDDGNDMI